MKTILNINDVSAWYKYKEGSSFPDEKREAFTQLPVHLQKIIKEETWLSPKHLTKEVFRDIFVLYLKKTNPNYLLDDYSSAVIEIISEYFTKDPGFLKRDPSYTYSKGLLTMGRVGCGKTLLMRGLERMLTSIFDIRFQLIPSYTFVKDFAKNGFNFFDNESIIEGLFTNIYYGVKCIDDLGSEDIVSHYGTSVNVIGQVLLRRYDGGQETFGTTNLDRKSLKNFYGERIFSRMREMFNFLIMEGDDRRL